ncbi:MAG: 50S ribosomal protein L30 [Alistipes sp.]|nr:50S ribosomal protein L30 [Alistipes sp.]
MATLKITQVRSRIGATAQQRKNLDALGLKKIGRSVEHTDSVIIKGMLERVKHLVKVEEVAAAKAAAPKAEEAAVKPAAKKAAAPKAAKPAAAAKKVSKTTKKEEE